MTVLCLSRKSISLHHARLTVLYAYNITLKLKRIF